MKIEEKWVHPDGRELTTAGLVRNEEERLAKFKLDVEMSLAGFRLEDK